MNRVGKQGIEGLPAALEIVDGDSEAVVAEIAARLGAAAMKPALGFLSSVPPIRKQSPYFSFVNRGKESIVINLIEESDRAVFLNMVRQVRPTSSPNFRPGVMPGRLA